MKKNKLNKSYSANIISRKKPLKQANTARANHKQINLVRDVNLFRTPLDSINVELNDIKKTIQKNEHKRQRSCKLLIKNMNKYIAKENIIMSLRKELKYQKQLQKNLNLLKKYSDANNNLYKKNYEEICAYKVHLHTELSEFLKIMSDYEKKKKELEKEKNAMVKTNENLIKFKKEEQIKLRNRLDQLNDDIKNQSDNIEKLRNILRDFRNENNNYAVNIEKNEYEHDCRYEQLLKEYKRVENQYKYYNDLDSRNKKNLYDTINKNLFAEEEGRVKLKLQESQEKGKYLKNVIADIKTHIQEIDELNQKIMEDKAILKLLGKKAAEEYKKKMDKKYKNELSSINLKCNCTFTSL